MKAVLISLFLMTISAKAYQCDHYLSDDKKKETLEFVATEVYGYKSLAKFCEEDKHLDLQLGFAPNIFIFEEEEDDHYKLMVHYSYRSCTFLYNQTQKHLTKKSCYSTW